MSMHVPLMIGTEVSHNPGTPASVGNPVLCVQAGGSDSMSSALSDKMPRLGLGLDSRGLTPETAME